MDAILKTSYLTYRLPHFIDHATNKYFLGENPGGGGGGAFGSRIGYHFSRN